MVDTDWREILSFSQRELKQDDKEKLCESLSWMEADDIELNFTDLKTLFRLAQDILKFKSEQVNNLLGQLETSQRKTGKTKVTQIESPSKSTDSALETIVHQEEVIKANKEILEQLYNDIAELEGRKNKMEEDRNNFDRDSDSSRDVLSEMDAVAQLENEVTLKNRHIRKLLGDVKVLEEENTKLKEKLTVFKDKLTEATRLIENLTDQLFTITSETDKLKEILGKSEQTKANLSAEIESLRKELLEKDSNRDNVYEGIKSKVQYWKNIIRAKKTEIEALSNENAKLKVDLYNVTKATTLSPKIKKNIAEERKIKELQEKLSEASNEMMQSAIIIEQLKSENKQLTTLVEDAPDYSVTDVKNESDEGKERALINKLRSKNSNLTTALQSAEEMLTVREKELAEITSQLHILKSDERIDKLLEGLRNKTLQLKYKDEGIKELVKEVNVLNESLSDLQLENETMRQKFNIPPDRKIQTKGIMKNYREMEKEIYYIKKEVKKKENHLLNLELDIRSLNSKVLKLKKLLKETGCDEDKIEAVCHSSEDDVIPDDGGGESLMILAKRKIKEKSSVDVTKLEEQIKELSEENEGLRKGLQEILDFLKDNSSTSAGVLALQCPSLDAILRSMEARHAAGWFAPHMAAVMELRATLGGKDALLTALNEARKETFDVMTLLSKESAKSSELERKLQEINDENVDGANSSDIKADIEEGEFGTWISDRDEINIDLYNRYEIETMMKNKNFTYENQLRNVLMYFHNKFKTLFDKMTAIVVQSADDKNEWSIQDEQYKARIENLKAQLHQDDDEDNSDVSPGIVTVPSTNFLQRKWSYLEESYKYVRTLNENMKNEYLECKKDAMIAASNYESQIQKLMLNIANLTDKLRYSVSAELFWKQNTIMNDINLKYRKVLDHEFKNHNETKDLLKRLEDNKSDTIDTFRKNFLPVVEDTTEIKTMLSNIEHSVLTKQLEELCTELDSKNKQIEKLETKNSELQELQRKIIDDSLSSTTKEEVDLMKYQLDKLAEENKILKEQCQHIESQLDIALLQLQDRQQRQLCNDLEINMLRHQILDLQSAGDNKAIVARLSGEVLVAHLQATESNKKIERLNIYLNKEKQLRFEAEEMLTARQKVFDIYASRYESKFRYMFEVLQVLRHQYQGNVPLVPIEKYLKNIEEISRKNHEVHVKLDDIEDLRSNLMTKHTVFNQILDVSKNKCLEKEDNCQHKLEKTLMERIHIRELEYYKKKINTLDQSREELLRRCNDLEKLLLHVNQGFEKPNLDDVRDRKNSITEPNGSSNLELEDVYSDDECSVKTNQTFTLPKPKLLKPAKTNDDMTLSRKENLSTFETVNVSIQANLESKKFSKLVQTDDTERPNKLKWQVDELKKELERKSRELTEAMHLARQRTEELITLNTEKLKFETRIQNFQVLIRQKENLNERLRMTIEDLQKQIENYINSQATQKPQYTQEIIDEKDSTIETLKQLENDKNSIVAEYKTLLNNERSRYSESLKDMQMKINELQALKSRSSETDASNGDALKEVTHKYHLKLGELEDKFFKTQSELDGCKAELLTYQSEVDRWKSLATERLTKMEQLNSQLEERHLHEVESYKAENDHWLSQLNETQREHLQLRTRLAEQKASYMKQLAEKDAHIEQQRSIINALKTQIMNMQTMISIADPSFDLSAIVEVEEGCDTVSHPGSERLELKFDSSVDLHDFDDQLKVQASSTAIWQEPIIERLRREKQLTSKQNAILRKQIKALASRERRARLDAQNLRNQVYRISTSGSKAATAESSALHTKIASLQAQLTTARKETHASVALWDKWKKAQQASDRWRMRYEEKCREVKKVESSLTLAKTTIERLQKDKRVLMARLSEAKNESLFVMEKQDGEPSEKSPRRTRDDRGYDEVPVSSRALMERIEAQQRRIVALEAAEKGNEYLVAEYEKSIAEVTSLKGQVLKLESTLLETQIRSPMKNTHDSMPELEYWKSYCEMLKEENVQLNIRVNSLETAPTTAHQHRVNDLEQTVLTLRGLVSKLQSEQKTARSLKYTTAVESRPSSSRSGGTEKNRSQLESHRLEIANLKRSIQDKDLLLERSKEMLKIAAEREDDLLRENASLRGQVQELMRPREGFLSA